MNIRDIHTTVGRPDYAHAASGAGKVEEVRPVQTAAGSTSGDSQDSVEISAAARAAAQDTKAQEMNFAKKALLGIPPLSEDRAADILKRVQEGHYSQPEVLKQIATKVVEDLSGTAG